MTIFTVNTLEDENDGLDAGNVSLRDAISAANTSTSRDKIIFAPSLRGETITLANGIIQIIDDLTIEGAIAIDANAQSGIFLIDDGLAESQIRIRLKGLTLTNSANQDPLIATNQAIINSENLNINNLEIANNAVGGIDNTGKLEITRTRIHNNSSGIFGAGIRNTGTAKITNSKIYDNSSGTDGGAIANTGTLNIDNTTITKNAAVINAGGISSNGNLTISNSTISNNTARNNGGIANGGIAKLTDVIISNNQGESEAGGIANVGILTIIDSQIFENEGNNGGGISSTRELTIKNSEITNNKANDFNGGINTFNNSNTTIINSTIAENESQNGAGGIGNKGNLLTIVNTTISGNSSSNDGAGGLLNIPSSRANLTNVTISGNSTTTQGGGILNEGILTINNSTITKNTAPSTQGGGIMTTQTGTTAIANSIIAGNLSGSEDIGTDVDFDGTNNYTSNDGNLIGTGSAITIFNQNQDNTDVTNPKLEPLADNGGPTQTHNLESDSPALDAGVNSALPEDTLDLNSDSNTSEALPIDQRGSARIANETVDIGAVEVPGVIRGTNRRDSLSGSLLDDTIEGLGGDDTLRGVNGDDSLDGGRANDVLQGGSGDDTLVGGSGRDRFQFNNLRERLDTITDFKPEADLITISGRGFGGSLSVGSLPEDQLLTISRFTQLDDSFNLGFVYAQNVRRLAFIDTEEDIPLTQFAILRNQPELEASNIQVF